MWRIIVYSGGLYAVAHMVSEPDILIAAWMIVGIACAWAENQKGK